MKIINCILLVLCALFASLVIPYTILCRVTSNRAIDNKKTTNIQANKNYFVENSYATYEIKDNIGYFKSRTGNFEMKIECSAIEQGYKIEMKGNTAGWVSIGFGRTRDMKDAEIIMGFVKLGKGYLTHHYGTALYQHKPIKEMQRTLRKRVIKLLHGHEKDGITTIKFIRLIDIEGKYYKNLERGQVIELMYALGINDKTKRRHKERGFLKIKLP